MSEHLSPEQIANCLIGDSSPEEQTHVKDCPTCGAELEGLRKSFSLYRESTHRWSDHWITKTECKPPPRRQTKWMLAGGLAAAMFAGIYFIRTPVQPPVMNPEPFVQIPYVVAPAPYERTAVKRMIVPVAALRSAGLAIRMVDAGASVRADVLLGQDGRALAVRLVSDSESTPNRRYNR